MSIEVFKAGIEALQLENNSHELIHGEDGLGLALSCECERISAIGLLLEAIETSDKVQSMPNNFLSMIGELVQYHAEIAKEIGGAIQCEVPQKEDE